jgi:hypothetical protein
LVSPRRLPIRPASWKPFRGVNQTTPIDVASVSAHDETGTNTFPFGAITTVGNFTMLVFIGSVNLNSGTQSISTVKTYSGFTNQGILVSSSGSDTGSVAGAYGVKDTAGAITSPSATYNWSIAANAIVAVFGLKIENNDAIVVSGTLPGLTSSGAIVVKDALTGSPTLPHPLTMTAAATNGEYVVASGTLPSPVTMSAAVVVNNTVNANVTLPMGPRTSRGCRPSPRLLSTTPRTSLVPCRCSTASATALLGSTLTPPAHCLALACPRRPIASTMRTAI